MQDSPQSSAARAQPRTPTSARAWFPLDRAPLTVVALAVGLITTLIMVAGNWIPAYDSDEAASLTAARLSFPDFFVMLGKIDAVHGVYYTALHLWMALFGDGELSTRTLSALFIGGSAAGLVVLGARIASVNIGVLAATIFTLLPATTHAAMQTRPYALGVLATVWTVVVLVRALDRGSIGAWVLYGVAVVISVHIFIYGILILGAHLLFVLARRRDRFISWLVTTAIAGLLCVPLALLAYSERDQVSWIATLPAPNLQSVFVNPAFLQVQSIAYLALGLLVLMLIRFRWVAARYGRSTIVLALAWAMVPALVLWAGSFVADGMLVPRYLTFTIPGIALVMALGIGALQRWWLSAIAVVAIAALTVPSFIGEHRGSVKFGGGAFRAIADATAEGACPGDAFFLQNDATYGERPRWAFIAYPDRFEGLTDIALVKNNLLDGYYSETTATVPELEPALDDTDRIWVARTLMPSEQITELEAALEERGFVALSSERLRNSLVTEYSRIPGDTGDCSARG